MKKVTTLLLALLALSLYITPGFASQTASAIRSCIITITNNSTATTNVATVFTGNTTAWIANGEINSSGNNTAIRTTGGTDVKYMPGYGPDGNPWCLWVDSIGTNTNIADILYTGGSDNMDGDIRYFPGSTGMNSGDPASMEPGDNFIIQTSGWIDTTYSANRTIVYKENAFVTYISGTGNITSAVSGIEDFLTYTEVDVGNKLTVTANEALAADVDKDEDVYLYKDQGVNSIDALDIDFEFLIASTSVDAAAGGMAISNTVSSIAGFAATDISVVVRRDGADYKVSLYRGLAVATDTYVGAADTPYYCTLERAAGNDTVTVDIFDESTRGTPVDTLSVAGFGATQYRYSYGFVNSNSANPNINFDGYVRALRLRPDYEVTASGVASGEHDIETSGSAAFLGLGIDIGDDTGFPFVNDSIIFNAPLWDSALSGSPFNAVDSYATSCTVTGATWGADGRTFNGATDYIAVPITNFSGTAGTISIWVQIVSDENAQVIPFSISRNADATVTQLQVILDQRVAATDDLIILCHVDGASKWGIGIDEAVFNARTNTNWNNVTVVQDGVSPLLYLNGANITDFSLTTDKTIWFDDLIGAASPSDVVTLGAKRTNGGIAATAFGGNIGESLVTNYALTPTQVSQLYDSTVWKYIGADITDDLQYVYSGVSVPDNGNDWIVSYNATMPYILHHKQWVGGNLVQHIEWEYSDTFSDLSGNSNDATPSFRGASSSAFVSAALTSCSPISEARAPAYTLSEAPDFFVVLPGAGGGAGGVTGNFTVNVTPTYPGRGVITAIAVKGAVPETLLTMIFAGFVLILLSLGVSYMMKTTGVNSLFIKMCIITAIMCVLVGVQIFDVWQIYFFVLMGMSLCWLSRQREAH